jgi:hypothetical protein
LHKDSKRERKKEGGTKKNGVRGKRYERTLSLSLSSSPSFGYSTTYAEVGRRTRERERNIEKKKASYVPSYSPHITTTTTTTAVRKKQCGIVELGKRSTDIS